MMGSMYASISGLKNHTTWMNTIGSNISNVNTVAYKTQRVTFKEQVSQSLGSASAASTAGNIGGKNPMQQGLGATLGSIDTIMTQGAIQTTGNPLDVAITGEGFFTVASGARTMYTRAGNFLQDNVGNVTTSDGGIVQGWMGSLERTFLDDAARNPAFQIDSATYTINTSDVSQIGNVNIPSDLRMAAQATRFVKFSGNLDSNTPINNYATNVPAAAPTALPSNFSPNSAPSQLAGGASVNLDDVQDGAAGTNYYFHTDPADENSAKIAPDHTSTFTVYDSLGNPRNLTVWFFQHGTDPTGAGNDYRPVWDWYAFDTTYDPRFDNLTGEPDYFNCVGGTNIDMANGGGLNEQNVMSPIWFNQDGSLASSGGGWDTGTGGVGFARQPLWSVIDGQDIYGPEITFLQTPAPGAGQGIMPDGALDLDFQLHFGTPNSWDTTTGSATGVVTVNDPAGNTAIDPAQPGLRDGLTGDVSGEYQIVGGVSTYIPDNTAYAKETDGWRAGDMIGMNVDSTGSIVGEFSNEKTLTIAKLALATFSNPQGLSKAGGNMYSISANSGTARMNEAGVAGAGTTVGGALEGSNVDLSVELTNMIIAQRGFESNARIVTTSATMLDTLVNIGR